MRLTSRNKPLYLLDVLTLDNLGTPEAREATTLRGHAFHEAGHAWAAHQSELSLRPASIAQDGKPYTGLTSFATAWLAALGPLTQGVAIEADVYAYNDESFTTRTLGCSSAMRTTFGSTRPRSARRRAAADAVATI